jgi:hypothetical protein
MASTNHYELGEHISSMLNFMTMVLLMYKKLPDTYFLDASLQEESSTALKLHLLFSFHSTNTAVLHAMRLAGNGEVNLTKIKTFITVCNHLRIF